MQNNENKKTITELIREILELETVVKNLMVLLVNYESNLIYKSEKLKFDIDKLDLKFSPFMVKFVALHNEILDKINENEKLFDSLKNGDK